MLDGWHIPSEKCDGVEHFVDHSERGEGIPTPDSPLGKKRAHIRAPCVSCPTQQLFQKAPVVLKGWWQGYFGTGLDPGLPFMVVHPSGEEFVVARVLMVLAHPVFMGELPLKFRVAEDRCSICCCSSLSDKIHWLSYLIDRQHRRQCTCSRQSQCFA